MHITLEDLWISQKKPKKKTRTAHITNGLTVRISRYILASTAPFLPAFLPFKTSFYSGNFRVPWYHNHSTVLSTFSWIVCLKRQKHTWFTGRICFLHLHDKSQKNNNNRYFASILSYSFSFVGSQTAFCFMKTSSDTPTRPSNIKTSREKAADRSLPFFDDSRSSSSSRAQSSCSGIWMSYSFLLLALLTTVWDHLISSCKSAFEMCVETVSSWLVCWHSTYQHRHT